MSVIDNSLLLTAPAGSSSYQISRSLRFSPPDSSFLSKSFASSGNRKTWTWAAWVKRSAGGTEQCLFSGGTGSNNSTFGQVIFANNDSLRVNGYSATWRETAQIFRDYSAWYHIIISFDTTKATAADRVRVFVNGVQVTTFAQSSDPTQNTDYGINQADAHNIGKTTLASGYISAYFADVHFLDGTAVTDAAGFTTTDLTTGQLIPKAYTGNYGLVSVAEATGALPIFNTTGTYGVVKGVGTRTDSNSASIVLAVPMDGTSGGTSFSDQSATIKGSGSAKTITVNGNTVTSTSQSKFYGSSGYFDGSGDYLTLANNSDFDFGSGNYTLEVWVYPTDVSTTRNVLSRSFNGGTGNYSGFILSTSNFLETTTQTAWDVTISKTLTANTWQHLAVVRNSNTWTYYINGVSVGTATVSGSVPTGPGDVQIGRRDGQGEFQGYMSDVRIYKGVAKYTSNFTPVISQVNSFHLPFSDNSTTAALGTDTSGNGNTWTVNNFSVTAGVNNDSLVDTPTSYGTDTGVGNEVRGNYCTLNPLDSGGGTVSNGNLEHTYNSSNLRVKSTISIPVTGKWYAEFVASNAGGGNSLVGIATGASALTGTNWYLGNDAGSWGLQIGSGTMYTYNNGGYSSFGTANNGDVIGVAVDRAAGKIWWSVNNTWIASGDPANGTNARYSNVPATDTLFFALSNANSSSIVCNFGQRAFAYTAPSGFKALVDTNLPTPVVAKGSAAFQTLLYTGNGSARSITGLDFSPDFVWIKARSSATQHNLYDAVRGATKELYSDYTDAEGTALQGLTAFNSNGFSLGSLSVVNGNGNSYVAWNWDGGTSTVTNTAGSISCQLRANASAGFSIIGWTGTGVNASIGHGLGVAPKMVITKNRTDSGTPWAVDLIGVLPTSPSYLLLNSTQAANAGGSTATSSVVNILEFNDRNGNGKAMIMYAFAPVSGYSSVSSYVGTGSADGPFVYTGFRPKFIMVKRSDASGEPWVIHDSTRDIYNGYSVELYPNSSAAEGGPYSPPIFDFLSNGFKIRSGGATAVNGSGGTFIYYAVAESPFQYARAR